MEVSQRVALSGRQGRLPAHYQGGFLHMQKGGETGRDRQAGASALAAARLRHASAGRRRQPGDHPKAAGALGHKNHGPLSARDRCRHSFHQKPARNARLARSGAGRERRSTKAMNDRPEVADIFRTYEKTSSPGGDTFSTPNSEKPSLPFATAARLLSAAMWSMWSSAIRSGISPFHITRAGTEARS